MSFFAKIEQFCSGLIERAFAKTFPSDLEPAQIARKLVATMEARTRDDDGRLRAPGAYVVYVSTADFERLDEHQSYLERAWADLLRNLAAKVGVTFDEGKASVVMEQRASIPLGAIEIEPAPIEEARQSFRSADDRGRAAPATLSRRGNVANRSQRRGRDRAARSERFARTRRRRNQAAAGPSFAISARRTARSSTAGASSVSLA